MGKDAVVKGIKGHDSIGIINTCIDLANTPPCTHDSIRGAGRRYKDVIEEEKNLPPAKYRKSKYLHYSDYKSPTKYADALNDVKIYRDKKKLREEFYNADGCVRTILEFDEPQGDLL